MVITLLKLINQIIFNLQEEESTMAKFVARLETLGVYDLLERWGQTENEDIIQQIEAFEICVQKVAGSMEYKLEVYKNRVTDLELHARVLENKVEFYKE